MECQGSYVRVSKRPDKRLAAVFGPQALIIKLGCVKDGFVEQLRNLDGMCRGAGPVALESARAR